MAEMRNKRKKWYVRKIIKREFNKGNLVLLLAINKLVSYHCNGRDVEKLRKYYPRGTM